MKTLNNKVVAVTGAASGIGRALAMNLANQGAHLALSDVNLKGLEETVTIINELTASRCQTSIMKVDVADKEAVYQWADYVISEHGHIDVIINNAGVAGAELIEDLSYDDFNWVFDINFYGVLYCTKAFLPYLKKRPESHIVNISSVNGFVPVPGNSPYNCAKFAVKGFSMSLLQELRGSSVNVTSVHPGGIKTNIVKNSRFTEFGNTEAQHQKAVNSFDRLARTTAEQAADKITTAILKNKKSLLIGLDAKIMDIFTRLFPIFTTEFIGKMWGRSMTKNRP